MSRRHRAEKRERIPDSRYKSTLVSHLINMVMKNGKKTVAERIVYGAIERVSEKLEKGDPIDLLLGALENIRPKLEVKSRRVGGATFDRQQTLAFRWLIDAANNRKGVAMAEALASELVDAYNNTGTVVKKREDVHKMAQSNRAFAHLRW